MFSEPEVTVFGRGGRAGEDGDWLCESLRTPPYEIDITLYSRRLETSTLDHKLIGKLFAEQINQCESRITFSKANIQSVNTGCWKECRFKVLLHRLHSSDSQTLFTDYTVYDG